MSIKDVKGLMAIPSQPKELAKKLIKNDISGYVLGKDAQRELKKFSGKHTIVRTDPPNDTPEHEDEVFKAKNLSKEKTTRRADYEIGQDASAYETVSITNKLLEKFVDKAFGLNAQKQSAMTPGPSVGGAGKKFTSTEKNGDQTTEKQGGFKEKLPPQGGIGEAILYELGEPMSAAPATSDNPGWSGDSAKSGSDDGRDPDSNEKNKANEKENNKDDKNDDDTSIKDSLETIATMAAELFEKIDGVAVPDWAAEKVKLAQDAITHLYQELTNGEDNEDGDQEGNEQQSNDKTDTPKPSAFKESDEFKHNNGKTTGFNVVAKKAAKEYGSVEAGKRVAGAVLAKMRGGK